MINSLITTDKLCIFLLLNIFFTRDFYGREINTNQRSVRQKNSITENPCNLNNSWKIKPSYLLFQDKTFRKILGNGDFMISTEVDFSIVKPLYFFAELGYLRAKGYSIPSHILVSLQMIPFSLGLKGIFPIKSSLSLYIKAGPNWIGLKENSDYIYFKHGVFKYTFGATSGAGLLIHVYENFFLDLFTNFIYGRKSYIDKYSNIRIKRYFGGFQFGAGLSFSY